MTEENRYVQALRTDREVVQREQQKFQQAKSQQQLFLEELLARHSEAAAPLRVADVACGSGHVSLHLAGMYPRATFTLLDLNDDLLEEARRNAAPFGDRFEIRKADIFALPEELRGGFDVAVCWQTFSWLPEYERPLAEVLSLLRKGGRLYASFLANTVHDVEIRAKVTDFTRESSATGQSYDYNTYSARQIERFLEGRVAEARIHPFEMAIDLERIPPGLGTYTRRLADGGRIQISAGMLMNWVVLEAVA